MGAHGETVWNDKVEVGRVRRIAARGLTVNHIGDRVTVGDFSGDLFYFEHFEKSTVLTLRTDAGDEEHHQRFVELDLAHLTEISVEH